MLLDIQTCSPDVHPSEAEVKDGIEAASKALKSGADWEQAQFAAMSVCFKDWIEWPDSAILVDLEST